jgi:hypothetical protein
LTNGLSSIDFQVSVDPTSFFRVGQVFAVLVRLIEDLEQVTNEACLPTPKEMLKKPIAAWRASRKAMDKLRQSIADNNAKKREALITYFQRLDDASMRRFTAGPGNGLLECDIPDYTFKLRKSDTSDDYTYWNAHYKNRHRVAHSRINSEAREGAGPCPRYPDDEESPFISMYVGPVLVRRFIVVRKGRGSCVCLPIHTHARGGCSKQKDQDYYTIIYSSKDPPAPLEGETGLALPPLRIKAQYLSTTLSSASRLYFGKIYEIHHECPVWPLGLVHVD